MAYNAFAYLYDDLNAAADYDTLAAQIHTLLLSRGIKNGIVADLGCGTGEISLRLHKAGYDMIAVDASEDMLSVFREKLEAQGTNDILLLCQDLAKLDLFGTIKAAVCTFDTVNHLPPAILEQALKKAALFMEPGGLLVFDANTPYKHLEVLAGNEFVFEDEGFVCRWHNQYLPDIPATLISVSATENGEPFMLEEFLEYEYSLEELTIILKRAGFCVLHTIDGESFGPLHPQSQRYLVAAEKPI